MTVLYTVVCRAQGVGGGEGGLVRGPFWTHQYLIKTDTTVLTLGTGGPKGTHVRGEVRGSF